MRVKIIKDHEIINQNLKDRILEVKSFKKGEYLLRYLDLTFWIDKKKVIKIKEVKK